MYICQIFGKINLNHKLTMGNLMFPSTLTSTMKAADRRYPSPTPPPPRGGDLSYSYESSGFAAFLSELGGIVRLGSLGQRRTGRFSQKVFRLQASSFSLQKATQLHGWLRSYSTELTDVGSEDFQSSVFRPPLPKTKPNH